MRVLHLSDTHLTETGADMDGVDARAALAGLLHDLRHLVDLDLVVVTGDVADDGSEAGVRMAVDLIEGFATERGAAVAWTVGNHDDRDAFTRILGRRTGPGCASVADVDGLRVVTLDSLVPGRTAGALDARQLDWLTEVLVGDASLGTVVALHHPPIHPSSAPFLASVGLQHPKAVARALVGTDVPTVLCGHFHHTMSGSLAGVPVWVAPGVVTRIDRTAPAHVDRAVPGAGAGLLELPDDGPPTYLPLQARGTESEVCAEETS